MSPEDLLPVLCELHEAVRELVWSDSEHPRESTVGINPKGDRQAWFDAAADELVIDRLRNGFSRGRILSEERPEPVELGQPGPTLIIDPVDGSTNAKRHVPISGFAVSYTHEGDPLDPEHVAFGFVAPLQAGLPVVAARGRGCWRVDPTGERVGELLRVRPRVPLNEAMVSIECSKSSAGRYEGVFDAAGTIRSFGASVRSISMVAEGAVDAHLDLRGTLTPENYMAPALLVQEAGGVVVDAFGRRIEPILDLRDRRSVLVGSSLEMLEPFLIPEGCD